VCSNKQSNSFDGKTCVLSLSYGKDSLACLGAIEKLGWPLDRIVHAEIWATDTIPADLPPMVEFKAKADEIIKRRWGITVEHICATRGRRTPTKESSTASFQEASSSVQLRDSHLQEELGARNLNTETKLTYESIFYRTIKKSLKGERIYGFPMQKGNWCNSDLKMAPLRRVFR